MMNTEKLLHDWRQSSNEDLHILSLNLVWLGRLNEGYLDEWDM